MTSRNHATSTNPKIRSEVGAQLSAESAILKLSAQRVRHTRLNERLRDLSALMYPVTTDDIVLVCGPTGVGKSTLARFLVEDALKRNRAEMDADPGIVPAIYVEAPSSGEREFCWSLLYLEILNQLDGSLPLRKYAYGVNPETNKLEIPARLRSNSLAALRTAVERGLRDRGTKHLIIDEAAHIMHHRDNKRLAANINTLKSLSNRSGAQFILASSYDLFQMMSLSGQLARRTQVLHFERYRNDNNNDILAFKSCVMWFESALPELFSDRLLPHSSLLHENTLGCIGTLRDVLSRAARFMTGASGWSEALLTRSLLTIAQRNRIQEEIMEGEQLINLGLPIKVAA